MIFEDCCQFPIRLSNVKNCWSHWMHLVTCCKLSVGLSDKLTWIIKLKTRDVPNPTLQLWHYLELCTLQMATFSFIWKYISFLIDLEQKYSIREILIVLLKFSQTTMIGYNLSELTEIKLSIGNNLLAFHHINI